MNPWLWHSLPWRPCHTLRGDTCGECETRRGNLSQASSETLLPPAESNFLQVNVPSVGFMGHPDTGRAIGSRGDIPPNSTCQELESRLCAISMDKERNYCMVSLWFRQSYGETGIPEVE